jgi:phosphotransferase system enzyme I (PtsI)
LTRSREGGRRRSARILNGLPASTGIAIGRALILDRGNLQIFRAELEGDAVDGEVARLEAAVEETRAQLNEIRGDLSDRSGEEYAFIFDAHLLLLEDRHLVPEAIATVKREKVNAEWALDHAARRIEKVFAGIDDPYLKERAHDIADVHERVQRNLAGSDHHDLSDLTEDVILVAHSIPPSEVAGLQHEHVVGFVTEVGGATGHTAIVARSLEIPAIVGLEHALREIQPGALIVVDGESGEVTLSPSESALKKLAARRESILERERELVSNRALPAVTEDGLRVPLRANIELLGELPSAIDHGAEGIGLYRSEFLFLAKSPNMPTEDEHYETYRQLIEELKPHPVTIRTLDLGGEKYFHDVLGPGEANPVLGLRAIRLCLARPEIMEPQLRGIFRAAVHGEARLMFPLVSSMEEIGAIHDLLRKLRAELKAEGVRHDPDLPVGIMIEVPSAAEIADLMAPTVDFFAIGTNDLIQYTLAVDRSNEHVSHLFNPLHPAVLRLLDRTSKAARDAGIGLSLCGQMAADPLFAPLLIGLGIEELSMDPHSLPVVKEAIRAVSAADCRELARRAMTLASAEEIEQLLERRIGPKIAHLREKPGRRKSASRKSKAKG